MLLILLFPSLNMQAQEKANETLWYCWEETVKPDMNNKYLELAEELLIKCSEENFPFPIYTWSAHAKVYQLWSPISSLDDVQTIYNEWVRIMTNWGFFKFKAFSETIHHRYSKSCTVLEELSYAPENTEDSIESFNYSRMIELYLKPGTEREFKRAVKWINEQRADYGIQDYVMYARGGVGYNLPCFIVMYTHSSQEAYNEAFDSQPEAYREKFQEFLNRIFKLMRLPEEIEHYNFIPEISYFREGE